jgi:NAD(P)-dependent dehydrogenase (short-subunit alcohol dehydrogenase family)
VEHDFNGIDALVNIAGGFSMSGKVADSDPDAWARQLAIGLTTSYLATRAFLPLVRNRRGAILYFASAAALPGARVAEMSAYAVSKTGVIALMRAVAQEERESGVRANALAPTSIRTATNVEAMGESARYVEREQIAEAVEFLCFSEAARSFTGQVVQLG